MSDLKKAMLRAQEARKREDRDSVDSVGATDLSPVFEGIEAVEPGPRRTRVEETSPRTLRRNKVWSLFHEHGISDQVKILRTQVLSALQAKGGNSLLITSANPREGKTFTAVNLAVSLSQEINRTTLLVDADLRKPSVHQYFGLAPSLGLSDYLQERGDLVDLLVSPGIPNLTILPGGTPLGNSSELLGGPRMASLAEEMKRRYPDRFLIFDSASLLTTADPLVSSRFIDGILLVVASESTTSRDLDRCTELLDGKPLLGLVYNKARD